MQEGQLKAVLVGCGSMARAWMDAVKQLSDVRVVGLVDIRRASAEALAGKYGISSRAVFDTLKQAITATRPDMVFDVTVPEAHEPVTLEALEAGCHVLGEKPMTTSLDKARRMVAAAHQAQRLYAVIQNRRYEPNIQRVAAALHSGALGQIEEIHCDFFLGAHFGGFRDQMEFPLLLDMAIHTFDAARYLSAADPVTVYCHSFNPRRSWYQGDASAAAIFQMTGDIVYNYRGSWCAEGLQTSWNSQWRIIGTRGTLTWDGEKQILAQALKPDGEKGFVSQMQDLSFPDRVAEHQGHAGLIREFVDCVRHGRKPQTVCTDNIKSLAMVLAAVRSAQLGQRCPVQW